MPSPALPNRCDLHRAALNGDDEAVSWALETAADVNALDQEGRTPIMCAVAGDRWQEIDASDASFMTPKRLNAIRTMLHHPQISLHCLNAPHAATNGVIPLSMAAWLNFPNLVELLLKESADTVAVDGLDAHGATALMYAARDNSLQVVQLLLSHGARPDLRDCNFRSSIQYAVSHPQVLWLCESVLRRHRWRESQSTDTVKLSINACSESSAEELLSLARCSLPSLGKTCSRVLIDPPPQSIFAPGPLTRSIKTLVSTLSNPPDISFLRSLLFSPSLPTNSPSALYPLSVPILVNRPDERGWSAIHHACSFTGLVSSSPSKSSSPAGKIPEIEVLDILYLAGADISLFTSEEHFTPLHILAKTSISIPSTISSVVREQIRDFVTHLVRDLGAPLGARDKNDETCLHVAAEYGASKVVMDILLDLDRVINDGRVCKMKNARGLLAVDLAIKPELLDSFAAMKEKMDMATIRRGSVSSALSDSTIRGSEKHASLTAVVVDEFGISQPVSVEEAESSDPLDIDPIEKTQTLLSHMRSTLPTQFTLDQMESTTDVLVKYFLAKITAAKKEVDTAKRRRETVRANARILSASLYAHSQSQQNRSAARTVKKRKSWRNRGSEDSQMTRVSSTSSYVDVGTQTVVGVGKRESGTVKPHGHGQGWTDWFEGLIHAEDPNGTVRKKKDKKEKRVVEWESGVGGEFGFVGKLKEKEKEKGTISGTHRLKNWWKKMVTHDHHSHSSKYGGDKSGLNEKIAASASMSKLELVRDLQDPTVCRVGREPRLNAPAIGATASLTSLVPMEDDKDVHVLSQTLAIQQKSALYLAEHAEKRGEVTIGKALRTAPIVLGAVRKDLERIEMCLINAEEHLKGAEASVERVGRVLKRALKKRRAYMDSLSCSRASTPTPLTTKNVNFISECRSCTPDGSPTSVSTNSSGSPGFLGYSLSLSLRPSYSSISTAGSDCSIFTTASNITASNAGAVSHHHPVHRAEGQSQDMPQQHGDDDDDETRTMRRLMLRRIEAQLRAAYDEVDKVVNWISIVQDVVGGVKRRAYL